MEKDVGDSDEYVTDNDGDVSQNEINNERDESLDLFNANMSENDAKYNEGNYNYEIQQHDEAKNINHEHF